MASGIDLHSHQHERISCPAARGCSNSSGGIHGTRARRHGEMRWTCSSADRSPRCWPPSLGSAAPISGAPQVVSYDCPMCRTTTPSHRRPAVPAPKAKPSSLVSADDPACFGDLERVHAAAFQPAYACSRSWSRRRKRFSRPPWSGDRAFGGTSRSGRLSFRATFLRLAKAVKGITVGAIAPRPAGGGSARWSFGHSSAEIPLGGGQH